MTCEVSHQYSEAELFHFLLVIHSFSSFLFFDARILFCVQVISRMKRQKIVVQNQDKNTEVKLDKFVFRSSLERSVVSQKVGDFAL